MRIFGFVKKVIFVGLTILSSFTNETGLSSISMNNPECKTRPQVFNVNTDEPLFFPFSIKTSKCSFSHNNINYPYVKVWVPDVVKKMNVKVVNLMSRTNEARFIEWHQNCNCECKFFANVCNNKQHLNKNKCRRECKGVIDKECVIKSLFGILVVLSVNLIKREMLVNI